MHVFFSGSQTDSGKDLFYTYVAKLFEMDFFFLMYSLQKLLLRNKIFKGERGSPGCKTDEQEITSKANT